MKWVRVRFKVNPDDYRPIKFPPPGPYWCTGQNDDYSTIIAYIESDDLDEVYDFWPEAEDIDILVESDDIEFGGRFPRPDWWSET